MKLSAVWPWNCQLSDHETASVTHLFQSPWYDLCGWLGVKNQLSNQIYSLLPKSLFPDCMDDMMSGRVDSPGQRYASPTAPWGRIGVERSAFCDCGEGDQTPEHVLQACPLLDQLRHQTWQNQHHPGKQALGITGRPVHDNPRYDGNRTDGVEDTTVECWKMKKNRFLSENECPINLSASLLP